MPGIFFSSLLSAQSLWYLLNQTNQFYCGPDHLILMKNPLFSPAFSPRQNLQDRGLMQQHFWKGKLWLSFLISHFFLQQHEGPSPMGHGDNFPGCRESHLKGFTQVQCFQIDTYIYSCCRIGTSRVLPGCLSPCGIAAPLELLTLSQMDQEAAPLKIKSLFSSVSNHDTAAQHLILCVG